MPTTVTPVLKETSGTTAFLIILLYGELQSLLLELLVLENYVGFFLKFMLSSRGQFVSLSDTQQPSHVQKHR